MTSTRSELRLPSGPRQRPDKPGQAAGTCPPCPPVSPTDDAMLDRPERSARLARLCAFLAFRLWRQAIENVGFDGLAKDIPPCPGPGFGPIKLIGMSAWASLSHINHWNPTTLL